ncbi:uncharacterized protein LOC131320790 isoform X2 [Rhododendron vialii]|uniref:uncharacterized protein LOC131320790 isoform X2 n=1 Tax=Rhododendron vialii TaxID=182163 RepID=UPI00265FAD77|nr:uncharacterized protein LOC131320790 isoform X2 [Rhododendron vialii]
MQPKTRYEWDREMKSGRLHGRPPNPASKQGLKGKQEPIQNLSHSCGSLAFLSLSGDLLLCRFTAMAPNETEWTPCNVDADRCYLDMDLEDDITHYISSDNAEGLKSLLSHRDVRNGTYSYCRTTLLQSLCLFSALKCATALVDGKLGVRVDVNRDQLLHHYAARFSSPELVKLFLRYGARTDVRYARKVWWGQRNAPTQWNAPARYITLCCEGVGVLVSTRVSFQVDRKTHHVSILQRFGVC